MTLVPELRGHEERTPSEEMPHAAYANDLEAVDDRGV